MLNVNKIYLGDCLEVLRTFPAESVDMVLTSPPYDNLRDYKGYTFNFEGIANELYRVVKQGGVVVWVVGDATIKGSETGTSFKQALYFKEIGFNLHDTMIWEKQNCIPLYPSVKRYDSSFEYMFIFSKGQPNKWNPIKDRNKTESSKQREKYNTSYTNASGVVIHRNSSNTNSSYCKRRNVWLVPNGQVRGLKHPAPFPEKLAEDHILSWSNEGDIVLDPMCGSGTTLKMANKNKRNYIGIEISAEYIKIAEERIKTPPDYVVKPI